MKKLLFISGLLISAFVNAQEICGLQLAKYDQPDAMFRHGFENVVLNNSGAGNPGHHECANYRN